MNRDNVLALIRGYCKLHLSCNECILCCTKPLHDYSDDELVAMVDKIITYRVDHDDKIQLHIPTDHIRDVKKMINDSKSNVIFVDEDIEIKSDNSSDTDKSNDDFIQIYNPYNISNFTNGRKHIVKFNLVNTKGNIIDMRIAVRYIINSTPSKLYIGNGEDKSFYIIPMSDIISCMPME